MFIWQQGTRANTWMGVDQLPKAKLWPSPLGCLSLAGSGFTLKPFQGKDLSKAAAGFTLLLLDRRCREKKKKKRKKKS